MTAPSLAPPAIVQPEWIDFNGHLNVAFYLLLFDRGVDHVFEACGLGQAYAETRQLSYFAAEKHLRYLREVKVGETVQVALQLLEVDARKMRFAMEMRHAGGWLAATCESLAIHVDLATKKAAPWPDDIRAALDAMLAAHAALPVPDWAGKGIAMRR